MVSHHRPTDRLALSSMYLLLMKMMITTTMMTKSEIRRFGRPETWLHAFAHLRPPQSSTMMTTMKPSL